MVLVEIFSEGLSFQRELGFAQEPRMPVESETSVFYFKTASPTKRMWKNVWSWWWLESCGTLHPKLYSKGIWSKKTVKIAVWTTLIHPESSDSSDSNHQNFWMYPQKMDEPRQWKIYKKSFVVNATSWCIKRLVFVQFVLQLCNQTSQAGKWNSWRCIFLIQQISSCS